MTAKRTSFDTANWISSNPSTNRSQWTYSETMSKVLLSEIFWFEVDSKLIAKLEKSIIPPWQKKIIDCQNVDWGIQHVFLESHFDIAKLQAYTHNPITLIKIGKYLTNGVSITGYSLWCGSVENQGPKKGREQMILNKSSRDIVHHHKQVQQQSHFHTCLSYLDFCDHIKHITGA